MSAKSAVCASPSACPVSCRQVRYTMASRRIASFSSGGTTVGRTNTSAPRTPSTGTWRASPNRHWGRHVVPRMAAASLRRAGSQPVAQGPCLRHPAPEEQRQQFHDSMAEELVAAVAVTQREDGAAGAEPLRRESGHAPFHQKLNLACSSTTRPMSAEEDIPKKELSGCVPLSLKEKGLRLSWFKTLKKFARSSRSDFSLIQGRCVCLAKFKSVWKNRGPRKELRPTPGGPLALILK